jgi:TPR repeat protein
MKTYAFPLQLAKEAILLGRYSEALSLLKPLSDSGDTGAQFLRAYLHFWDDELNHDDAVNQIAQVAKRGHAEANYILAVCPDLSPGYVFSLPSDEKRKNFLQYAAEIGSDSAITDLAQIYLEGIDVEQDYKRARELLQRVYDRMHSRRCLPKTCLLLAKMLLEGLGGDQDIDLGLGALLRCQRNYGDPFAVKAISLYIDIVEQGKYGVHESHKYDLEHVKGELKKLRAIHLTSWQRYLDWYCLNTLRYDLRSSSFNQFVGFVFEHFEVLSEDRLAFNWSREAEILFDARTLLRYYTQLFREPAFLLDRYSKAEIERGLDVDGIRGFANWTVGCVMQSAENTVDEAETCIRAMYELFAKLFARVSFDTVEYMWWDVGYGACGRNSFPKREIQESDRQRLSQATFETMTRVLQLEARNCQSAAIHGLGHSSHPDKEQALLQFLHDNPDKSDRDRSYVMAAIEGKIL